MDIVYGLRKPPIVFLTRVLLVREGAGELVPLAGFL